MDGSVMEKWSRGAFDYAAREVDVEKTREEYRGILRHPSTSFDKLRMTKTQDDKGSG
jgi:hypothetical protein